MQKFTILSLFLMVISLVQAKDITVYVQADNQPHLHYWGYTQSESIWPGELLTDTKEVTPLAGGDAVTFYYKTFTEVADDGSISFLLSYNGEQHTANISNITADGYYIYKGQGLYEDVTAQYRAVIDADIASVKLPGDYVGWDGDKAIMTKGEGHVYTGTIDVSALDGTALTCKLLVNGSNWLGVSNLTVDAPEGWTQEAASDGNVQLNYGAIGATLYTVTATWGGGENIDNNWTLKFDADANAIIESVKLPGDYVGWDGDKAVMTKGEGLAYTYTLDLSAIESTTALLKLLVNGHHWLGYSDLTAVEAPEGWTEAATDNNIQLNLDAAGTKKFNVTATWKGGYNASAGWTLTIASTIPTAIDSIQATTMPTAVYDLQGRRLAPGQLTKGLYIVNGKKVLQK